jgi:Recombinase
LGFSKSYRMTDVANDLQLPVVVGYLRHYRRWNGMPGLSLAEQRALVRKIAREEHPYPTRSLKRPEDESYLGYDRFRSRFLEEGMDGQAKAWPILRKAIQIAEDHADEHWLVIIPTLDGVRFNLSFLALLGGSDASIDARRIYVRRSMANTKPRGWLLSLRGEATDFATMIKNIRRGNRTRSSSLKAGLRQAAARGVKLGSRRRGSHRFTKSDQSKGGQVTAKKRRLAANDAYRAWVPDICHWRANGESLGMIAMKLAEKGARTPDGRKIGPMQVYRILKRSIMKG